MGKLTLRNVEIPESIESFFTDQSVNARTMFMSGQLDAMCIKILDSVTEDDLLSLSPAQRIGVAKQMIEMRKSLIVQKVVEDNDVDGALEALKKTGRVKGGQRDGREA